MSPSVHPEYHLQKYLSMAQLLVCNPTPTTILVALDCATRFVESTLKTPGFAIQFYGVSLLLAECFAQHAYRRLEDGVHAEIQEEVRSACRKLLQASTCLREQVQANYGSPLQRPESFL